ncbi:MAG: hypothetical protein EOP06_01945 [Proteobacteria bacterium]|nr:MAG: hypothetical protein EOP06_01945 [Pseudomonadota bacterium]
MLNRIRGYLSNQCIADLLDLPNWNNEEHSSLSEIELEVIEQLSPNRFTTSFRGRSFEVSSVLNPDGLEHFHVHHENLVSRIEWQTLLRAVGGVGTLTKHSNQTAYKVLLIGCDDQGCLNFKAADSGLLMRLTEPDLVFIKIDLKVGDKEYLFQGSNFI